MARIEVRSFDAPDETRPSIDKGRIHVLTIAGHTVGRGVFEPGWRRSSHVESIVETDSRQVAHLGHAVSGRQPTGPAEAGPTSHTRAAHPKGVS